MSGVLLMMGKTLAEKSREFVWCISREADGVAKALPETQLGRIISVIALIYLGLVLLRAVVGILNFIFIYFLRPGKNLKFYGSWAIVTGATDGIGKAYCVELAKKGKRLLPHPTTMAFFFDRRSFF